MCFPIGLLDCWYGKTKSYFSGMSGKIMLCPVVM